VCGENTSGSEIWVVGEKSQRSIIWLSFLDFTILYGIHNQGYCHLVVSAMAILPFGAMCRYSDVNRLRWRNVQFDNDLQYLEIAFELRINNSDFCQGNKVTVAANNALVSLQN